MRTLRLAIPTRLFRGALRDTCRAAAATGAAGVQFDAREELKPGDLTESGRRQFLHHLEEIGLSVASLTFPTRHPLCEPTGLDARVAAIRKALEWAYDLKAPLLTIRPGRIPSDPASKDAMLLVEVLSDLARHANHVGSTLALTPLPDDPKAWETLLGQVSQHGPVGLDFDPASFAMAGHKPHVVLRELHTHVVHVAGRDGMRDLEGAGLETQLGRGEVDWVEIIALLGEMRYPGWITVQRTQGTDPAADCQRALMYLENVAIG